MRDDVRWARVEGSCLDTGFSLETKQGGTTEEVYEPSGKMFQRWKQRARREAVRINQQKVYESNLRPEGQDIVDNKTIGSGVTQPLHFLLA